MDIKSGSLPDIKGTDSAPQKSLPTSSKSKTEKVQDSPVESKIQFNSQKSKIRSILKDIKEAQTELSKTHLVIESLKKAKNIILNDQDLNKIREELTTLSRNTKFNQKLLLKTMIPADKDYYSAKNVEQLVYRISQEITTSEKKQSQIIQKLNASNIALENINASRIGSDIHDLKGLPLKNKNIYKDLDHQVIISLIKGK
ncbi:MAG: hypothetical protein JW827_01350 [Spirochaetes bacterium]|nr:hypothetical protein [Spirochaetota bacterium]